MHLPKLRAQELIRQKAAQTAFDEHQVYQTVLIATDDEDAADKARANFLLSKMNNEQ